MALCSTFCMRPMREFGGALKTRATEGLAPENPVRALEQDGVLERIRLAVRDGARRAANGEHEPLAAEPVGPQARQQGLDQFGHRIGMRLRPIAVPHGRVALRLDQRQLDLLLLDLADVSGVDVLDGIRRHTEVSETRRGSGRGQAGDRTELM